MSIAGVGQLRGKSYEKRQAGRKRLPDSSPKSIDPDASPYSNQSDLGVTGPEVAGYHWPLPPRPPQLSKMFYPATFFLCLVLLTVTVMFFLREGWALIRVPQFNLPNLG